MNITGHLLLGSREAWGRQAAFHALNPATGEPLAPAFSGAGEAEVREACAMAAAAYSSFRQTSSEQRADFLLRIALNIIALGRELLDRAASETGYPRGRLESECTRTINQLHLFGNLVRSGQWQGVRIDHAMPERTPLPRQDLRLRHIGIGPVAVFGASNFPLAFSVAGGDTASALAAGCPVVFKGHPAHPGTSELVGRAIQKAVAECNLHEGVFSLLSGPSPQLGASLVTDPCIKAVGFTGSRSGGLALMRTAANRPEPIPFHAEMSSINPVVLLPGALKARAETIAANFVSALTMGAGQFCTNPGLVIAMDSPELDAFTEAAARILSATPAATMLTPGIHAAYTSKIGKLTAHPALRHSAYGMRDEGPNQCRAALLAIDAETFLADPLWQDEVFGAASVIVRCADLASLEAVIEKLEGQLTATIHMEDADSELAGTLLPALEEKAGRVIVNGFPTGVEVCDAIVHGGPFPATSDARSTSVGTLAIGRFLRPVCYQNFPTRLLPDCLKEEAPA